MATTELDKRRRRFPRGASLTWDALNDLDQLPVLHGVREHEPVTWCDALGGWLVSSRELLEEVYQSPDRFTVEGEQNFVRRVLGDMMLTNDGSEHGRHREPFAPAFHLRASKERFSSRIEELTGELLAEFAADGQADLRARLATPFAVAMGADLLGLDLSERTRVSEFYDAFAAAMVAYDDEATLRRGLDAREQFGAEIRRQLAMLDRSGDRSLIRDAVAALDDEEEVVANARVILFGAIETVESMILNTLWSLLHHPDQLARVIAEPDCVPAAIDEALRWMPPVGFVERWAIDKTTLGGISIGRGEFVVGAILLANRDPAFFADPDRFDVDRPNARKSFAFSHGPHHCLGFNLARLEGRIVLQRALASLPGLELDADHPSRPHGFAGRRLDALHVRWRQTRIA